MSEFRFHVLRICEKCQESLCDECKDRLKKIDDYLNRIYTHLENMMVIVERMESHLRDLRLSHAG